MATKRMVAGSGDPILFHDGPLYMLSNFASFVVMYDGELYLTAEHAYQAAKFYDFDIKDKIKSAPSAHEAKKIAHAHENEKRSDWENIKLFVMEDIIWAKLSQHPIIQEKLLQTGERTIIEDSQDDAFWGSGPDKNGGNHLGRIWVKLRKKLREKPIRDLFFGSTPFGDR